MTPTAAAPATANGTPHPPAVSPVEYVRGLPPEDQEDVLFFLVRELIAVNGGEGLIPINTHEGEWLGYYVPPKAAAARAALYGPKLTPEREAELAERQRNPGEWLSEEELLEWLKTAEPAPTR